MTGELPSDGHFMALAVEEARRGLGRTAPNPPVGCVLVREGVVVARGWHRRAGSDHAEVDALRQLGAGAEGATAYVTLEPCNHTGRTGPCTEALIAAGVRRVVVGALDPNPVAGGGSSRLRAAGIEVVTGVGRPACEELIAPFARWVTTGLPWVLLKQAATLDGCIGEACRGRVTISGPEAHAHVHGLRDRLDAILVGVGTVLADDPRLTTRLPSRELLQAGPVGSHAAAPAHGATEQPPGVGRDPLRVVLDTHLRMPPGAAMLHSGSASATLVLTSADPDGPAARALRGAGAEVVSVGSGEGGVDLLEALRELGRRGVHSVLAEAGPTMAASLLRQRLVSRIAWFFAPLLLGDPAAPRLVGSLGTSLDAALRLGPLRATPVGADLLIEADVEDVRCSRGS
ncbi:MAG: riboflavin biosynthesis protein RibD [Myxococcales bacterium]